MAIVAEHSADVGVSAACSAAGVARATWYRAHKPKVFGPRKPARRQPRALSAAEELRVLTVLNSERFQDKCVGEAHATLLEEGQYLCSERTMYRVLKRHAQVKERRNQLRHPVYARPELLATGPRQVFSWDITKLKGPEKWKYYQLYVILDIYSRYVVGWMLADRESAELAAQFIDETCEKEGIEPGQLVLHADRGTAMTSLAVGQLLANLGVVRTHSRPQVSNDNPYSESQFKTMKYRPEFPKRFGSFEDAKAFLRDFFAWYNCEHHHEGIAMLTPADLHHGRADAVLERRHQVMLKAYAANPQRFVAGAPRRAVVPDAAWINQPASSATPSESPERV